MQVEQQNHNHIVPKSSLNTMFKYSYKHKYHINLKQINFLKTRVEFSSQQVNIDFGNGTIEYRNKTLPKIIRFPTSKDYAVLFRDNCFDIYNSISWKKLSTYKSNNTNGFEKIIALPGEWVLGTGLNFIKSFKFIFNGDESKCNEKNHVFPISEKTIYARAITNKFAIICKNTVCYIYNIDKNGFERIIYLKSLIKLLNNKRYFGEPKNDIDLNEDFFSCCKIFSKNEFCLCYKNLIFFIRVPECYVLTYIDITDNNLNMNQNSKKFVKRIKLVLEKNIIKNYYVVWQEKTNFLKIYSRKNNLELIGAEKFIISNSDSANQDYNDINNLIVSYNNLEIVAYEKNILMNENQKVFNIKQNSNYEIIVITINNDIHIYNFLSNRFITTIKYANIILNNGLYFLKRIGNDLFFMNLKSGFLALVGIKTGKILKKFNVDYKPVNDIDICDIPVFNDDRFQYRKHVLLLNSTNMYALEFN